MQAHSDLYHNLLATQNEDGGWSYGRGQSWTEPTSLALLALESVKDVGPAYQGGVRWLSSRQRPDGGWGPNDTVSTSTSVTSVALLAVAKHIPSRSYSAGICWLMQQMKPDLTLLERARHLLEDLPQKETVSGGSPFYPNAGEWVAPTVMSVLAFMQALERGYPDPNLNIQLERARAYLLSRRCHDGGWNHGSSQVRSSAFTSYPEMTGLGLLASRASSGLESTLSLANKMLHAPESAEAQACLALGLARHKQPVVVESWLPCRTARDTALQLLAQQITVPNHPLLIPR